MPPLTHAANTGTMYTKSTCSTAQWLPRTRYVLSLDATFKSNRQVKQICATQTIIFLLHPAALLEAERIFVITEYFYTIESRQFLETLILEQSDNLWITATGLI